MSLLSKIKKKESERERKRRIKDGECPQQCIRWDSNREVGGFHRFCQISVQKGYYQHDNLSDCADRCSAVQCLVERSRAVQGRSVQSLEVEQSVVASILA